jgi:hypothetical protein
MRAVRAWLHAPIYWSARLIYYITLSQINAHQTLVHDLYYLFSSLSLTSKQLKTIICYQKTKLTFPFARSLTYPMATVARQRCTRNAIPILMPTHRSVATEYYTTVFLRRLGRCSGWDWWLLSIMLSIIAAASVTNMMHFIVQPTLLCSVWDLVSVENVGEKC